MSRLRNNKISRDQGEMVNRLYISIPFKDNKPIEIEVNFHRKRRNGFNIFVMLETNYLVEILGVLNVWAAQKIVQGLILEYSERDTRTDLRWMLE